MIIHICKFGVSSGLFIQLHDRPDRAARVLRYISHTCQVEDIFQYDSYHVEYPYRELHDTGLTVRSIFWM